MFLGRTWLVLQATAFAIGLTLWRTAFSAIALPQRLKRRLVIIGAGKAGRRLLEALRRRPHGGFQAVGFIDDDPTKAGRCIDGLPVLGDSGKLAVILDRHQIHLAVVAITHEKSSRLLRALAKIGFNGCQIVDMPGFYEFLTGKVPIDHISDVWLFLNSLQQNHTYYRRLKQVIDIVLGVFFLVVLSPLLAVLAALVKLDSPGPVFFRQERLGQDGKPFQIIKFRTMVQDAEQQGAQFAARNDERITRVGRVLRRFRLDELPQLINILKGEMSFVGPRPERQVFVRQFQELVPEFRPGRRAEDRPGAMVCCGYKERIPYYSYRLVVKPGITGWAQVMYPYAATLEQTWEKLQYDLFYIKHMSLFLDLAILLKTVRIILFARGR